MPEVPTRTGAVGRLVTQPRTGNCWHGLFFDIENVGSESHYHSVRVLYMASNACVRVLVEWSLVCACVRVVVALSLMRACVFW
jgi:hypothetical protein